MDRQKEAFSLVAKIPKGKVATYGQIAKILKMKSPRLIGRFLHKNRNPEKIPCHRVVFSDGRLAKNYAFGGLKAQKEKLLKEGIIFVKDRVDLRRLKFIADFS